LSLGAVQIIDELDDGLLCHLSSCVTALKYTPNRWLLRLGRSKAEAEKAGLLGLGRTSELDKLLDSHGLAFIDWLRA